MSETVRLSNFASIANAVFNSVSANATAVTSMSVGGQTINATPVFTGNTTMGNLAFSGTGTRITGDFSNATLASRVAFQTSVTNASTTLSVIPNGNNTQSDFFAYNSSDPNNASVLLMRAGTLETSIRSATTGTGTLLPMTFFAGGSERMRITTNGDVGIGTTNPVLGLGVFRDNGNGWAAWIGASAAGSRVGLGTRSSIASVQGFNSSGNGTDLALNPDAGNIAIGTTSATDRLTVVSASQPKISVQDSNGGAKMFMQAQMGVLGVFGSENNVAVSFVTNNTERMRINTDGAVRIGTNNTAGNSRLDVNVGITARTDASSGVTPYLQLINGNAGTDLKIWRIGATSAGALAIENVNDAYTSAVQRMLIDASGRVIRPQQPAFAAWGGSGITTTGSYQTCVFTNATTNIGSHYSTSTGRFTAPVAGLYHFTWFISQSGTATGPVSALHVNGGGISFAPAISYGTPYNNACSSVVLNLNANDFVDVRVIGFNSSFSFVDFGYSGFSGFLI